MEMESVRLICEYFVYASLHTRILEVIELSLTSGRVSGVAYNTDGVTAVFTVHHIEWKEAYASMRMDFGMTDASPSGQYSISGIRSHDSLRFRLRRRQAASSSTAVPSAAASSTVIYPSAPTSTPSSDSSIKNLDFSFANKSFISWSET
jgi:hypothetical protein